MGELSKSSLFDREERLSSWQMEAGPGARRSDEFAARPNGASKLESLVQGEVIPRLMLAHGGRAARAAPVAHIKPTSEDIDGLLADMLDANMVSAMSRVISLLERGADIEAIYLDLLAPAARRIGELWQEDACDFTGVTVGLCLLHRLLRRAAAGQGEPAPQGETRAILLAPVMGEQHTFGLVIVAELFRRAGWRVRQVMPGSLSDLVACAREEAFDVIGLSASREEQIRPLNEAVDALHSGSRVRSGIIVGGACFAESSEIAEAVGADAVASDGDAAVSAAEGLLDFADGH